MSRAKDQLLEKGFMKTIHAGGGFKKDKSIYELIDQWLLWQPGIVFEARKKQTIRRGFCKPKITSL